MNNLLTWLVRLFYPPCTPEGRARRVEHLMQATGEGIEVCKAIVYARDANRVPFTFTDEERSEAERLSDMLEQGRIRMPADRNR